MKQYWTKNKNGEDVWVTRDVAIRLIEDGKKKKEDFTIVETETRTPAEIAAQGEQEYAKMMDEIAAAQGGEGLLDQIAKGYAPMSAAEKARTGESSLLSNAYDALSFLPRLAITGYRELGDAVIGAAMGAVGGENYYTPNVAKRMSGEDSNVFFDELGNPFNYIPMAAAERAGAAIISKAAPKVAETISKLPKLTGLVRGAAEGAGTEYLSGKVEENATGKTDRSPLGGAAFGGVIGGGLAAGSRGLKKLGEKQVLSEIKIPGRTVKGANAPNVKNLLEYPVEYLPETQKHKSILGSKVDNFREKIEYPLMRKLTGDETIGTTRNLTGGDVSDILDRVNEITDGLVAERADDIKKIVDKEGFVNLDLVIDDVKEKVKISRKYDIEEKDAILSELERFRNTELATLADMQSRGVYNQTNSIPPLSKSPFDFTLDARERAKDRAKFETIKDPRRDKPIADTYADVYRNINDKVFGEADKIIYGSDGKTRVFKNGKMFEEVLDENGNLVRKPVDYVINKEDEVISFQHNISPEDVAAFGKTQEGLKRLVPFEIELPARSTVANGRQIVGLPALAAGAISAPVGGVVGSLAGPAGTTAGALGGAGVGASLGTALTRGSTAGKVMYETGKAIGPKRLLPKIITPTASRIANEPFRTTTETTKPMKKYKSDAAQWLPSSVRQID